MNLRKAKNYSISLDLGTGSVGWAVVDENGELYHVKGKPAWGARLFPSAQTAAETRLKRGQRRRYERRRQRIDALQSYFFAEIDKVDPEFFVRIRQSQLLKDDRDPNHDTDYRWPFFNGTDFTEKDYYQKYRTIWHLRKALMDSDEKMDIRLVYLALHNIVKYRGNFLQEDNGELRASNANAQAAAQNLADCLVAYVDYLTDSQILEGLSCEPDVKGIRGSLEQQGVSRAVRCEDLQAALGISDKKMGKALARACFGYDTEFSAIMPDIEKQEGTKLSVSQDEKREAFASLCTDEAGPLFEAIYQAYNSYVLSSLLQGENSVSCAMIKSYEQHRNDLKCVKGLIREHLGLDAYRKFFRGPKFPNGDYDFNKVAKGSYTSYVLGDNLCNKNGTTHEELIKRLRDLLSSSPEICSDNRYLEIKDRLEEDDGTFLSRQKTRANGAIPFQLHLEEMERIIDAQGKFYPFLLEHKDELLKLVSSRIPYYVGPLNTSPDPDAPYASNPVDESRKFAWSVRKPGTEGVKVYPWNYEDVIDVDETAGRFIRRMTGTCTYLLGEPVLPRHSLVYEEFCVLNELNGVRWAEGNEDPRRFDHTYRERIMDDLFREGRSKTVSHNALKTWLERNHGANASDIVIKGTQGETAFESKLDSYHDFCKILGVNRLDDPSCPLTTEDIENVILWCTIFEERSILKRKVERAYGDRLTEEQIRRITRLRYTGWGRLSHKFLSEIKAETPLGRKSIIDIMREGNPLTGQHLQAMNLMEVLTDKDLGFQDTIDNINKQKLECENGELSLEEIPGSPALRRTVNQAIRILDELVGIAGSQPTRICIEVTRDDDDSKKGKRTKKRYQKLSEALGVLKKDAEYFDPSVWGELKEHEQDLDQERLVLYFEQCGKSLYSRKPLDINRLSEYQVDHILPQSYIKDDSFDNKALVLQEENQMKLDSLLLDRGVISRQKDWWKALNAAGLISDKKYRLLTCTDISDHMLQGFINRQLVETSQVIKLVRQICEQRYPGTEVVSLRASLSHGLRESCDLVKCRELNDYHHAHDAYLAAQMARFIAYRYPSWQDGFDLSLVRRYVKNLAKSHKPGTNMPGRSGFIVDSFLRDGFDRETGEIFKDAWDAQNTIARIRTTLGYKECFITRMPEEQTGAFWEETIFSPRDTKNGKNLSIPTKMSGVNGGLDPKAYGGSNTEFRAYFFIFEAVDNKGRTKYFFEGVPVRLAKQVVSNPGVLREYAEQLAVAAGCHNAKILRKKVPLRQKFLLDGTEFYLFGRTGKNNEIRAGKEILLPNIIIKLLNKGLKDDTGCLTVSQRLIVFSALNEALAVSCPKLYRVLALSDKMPSLSDIDATAFAKLLKSICLAANGTSKGANLKSIGGKETAGFMQINIAASLHKIIWIDQSVTGIFEKRTTFEELTHGI